MHKIWNKGHRIRASDKHLVYHFFIGTLLFIFATVFLLLNSKQLMRTDWKHFSLLENGLTLSPYNFITIGIATGVCALVAFLYYRFCYDSFKKLLHRQKLARMILENKWYEADTVQDSGFFTDLQSRSREKIVWFPKIYYQMEKGLLHIRCEITLGKYQDQLLRLEDKLESGLYRELTDKTLHDGYIEYTLLYDMIANRITIDEVRAENGCLRLMKNLVWEYDALPHALIAGGTGGGKTYFLLTLIEALLHTNAVLYILDPKNADLADLGTVMGNVYHTKEEMIDCVNAFYEGMVRRSEEMKRHPNYKTGENYVIGFHGILHGADFRNHALQLPYRLDIFFLSCKALLRRVVPAVILRGGVQPVPRLFDKIDHAKGNPVIKHGYIIRFLPDIILFYEFLGLTLIHGVQVVHIEPPVLP